MDKWYMVTIVGKDQSGLVAKVSQALFQAGGNLGEASMARLGANFTIMLMTQFNGTANELGNALAPLAQSLNLHCHVDLIEGELHRHVEPDVRISVYGADCPGIVAEVTGALAENGLNILNLETDVGGAEEDPVYVMNIDGIASNGIEGLENALAKLADEKNLETRLLPINTMIG
ncbi:MAG: glycine cleavage system protein R [Nitrospinales bacterium]